jgi:hypothetical protein
MTRHGTFSRLFSAVFLVACNPAGDALSKARSQSVGTDTRSALVTYRSVIANYPESPEAAFAASEGASLALKLASAELTGAPDHAVSLARAIYAEWPNPPAYDVETDFLEALTPALSARVAHGSLLEVASVLRAMGEEPLPPSFEMAAAGLLRDDKKLSAAVAWVTTEGKDEATRATQALALLELTPEFQAVIQGWLNIHLFAGAAGRCVKPLSAVGEISKMEELDELQRNCEWMLKLAPLSADAADVQKQLAGAVEGRRRAIQRSPAYRVEQALAGCVEFQTWLSGVKRNPPRTEAGMEKLEGEMERRTPAMQRSLDYLMERVQSTEDWDLARRVREACSG